MGIILPFKKPAEKTKTKLKVVVEYEVVYDTFPDISEVDTWIGDVIQNDNIVSVSDVKFEAVSD